MSKLRIFLVGALLISHLASGQEVFTISPKMEKDDASRLKFTNTVVTSRASELGSTANYQVRFTVTDISDTSMGINWKYEHSALSNEYLAGLEDLLISKIREMNIAISGDWRTIHLLGKEAIRQQLEVVLNEEVRKSAGDKPRLTKMIDAKNLIASDQGIETVLLKHVRAYFSLHGFQFRESDVYVNNLLIPFALGNPIPAVETTRVSAFDKASSRCEIHFDKEVEVSELRKELRSFVAKANRNDAQLLEMVDKSTLIFTEKMYINATLEPGQFSVVLTNA